jgi:hypothetical protein
MTDRTHLNDLPTIIDGPGEYATRSGGRATVREIKASEPDTTAFAAKGSLWRMFRGALRPRGLEIWHVSGRVLPLEESGRDIVGRHVAPDTAAA